MLDKQPADLTQLSKNNGGEFPLQGIYSVIDGRGEGGSHGDRDMPVWGAFWTNSVAPEHAQYYVRGRILELILYLQSIQE